MENTNAHQLPEVDSLPDGFVESSEPLAHQTPTIVEEKPLGESEHDGICEFGSENASWQRTFPVPLREADSLEAPRDTSVYLAEVPDNGQHGQESLPVPVSAAGNSPCFDHAAGGCDSKKIPGSCTSSDGSIEGALDTHARESSSLESTELQKGQKLETAETKRKTTKKTSLSDKDILEFTLKYQQVLAERDAAISVRDKLESLCRELQRQNKMLTDECKKVSTEGQNLRLDLSARFQDAIKDVSTRLDEQKEESISQLKENEMLRSKLKQLLGQYNLSEQQHAQKLKQKELELEIAHLKIKQQEEKLVQEQSQIKVYAEQVSQLLATEKTLRLQLTSDGEKFQQFQEALLKSNEVFETFKLEIEKMAKSTKDLKKENRFLKNKCEKTDVTLIELVEERERMKKQLEKTKNQKEKLESLCRSLQAERKLMSTASNTLAVAED